MQAKRGGLTPEGLADVRPGLLSALASALPDLEWIDRNLELGDGRRVDLVGVDGSGRALALVLVGEDEEQALLAAESYSERMLARISGLDPAIVQALELRQVTSQRSVRTYLVPARSAIHGE